MALLLSVTPLLPLSCSGRLALWRPRPGPSISFSGWEARATVAGTGTELGWQWGDGGEEASRESIR